MEIEIGRLWIILREALSLGREIKKCLEGKIV